MEPASYAIAARGTKEASGSDASGVLWATGKVGAVTFICAGVYLEITATTAALIAMAVTFLFRSIAIAFNWRTAPVASGAIFRQGETEPPFPGAQKTEGSKD